MRALLAFDKFKDALPAADACAVAAAALRSLRPDWELDLCPLTDGGEGFATLLTQAADGKIHTITVTGPRGTPVRAGFGLVPPSRVPHAARAQLALPAATPPYAPIALIEMATASGLAHLPAAQRDPWQTTTFGTGELLRAAIAAGAAVIVLGVGGSATNDLGLGALAALGWRFLSASHEDVSPPVPGSWDRIVRLVSPPVAALPPIRIACDVANPLLGPHGCAAVYGPQKGLRPEDLAKLEQTSARLALLLCTRAGVRDEIMDTPGAGAAGGIAFGLMTAAGATLLPGFDFVSAWLDLDRRIAAADVVLTGEGRFDASSLAGKGPAAVAARARALGRPAHIFAGAVGTGVPPTSYAVHAITPAGTPLATALSATAANLAAAVRRTF